MIRVSISVSISVCYFFGGASSDRSIVRRLSTSSWAASIENTSPLTYPNHNNQLHQHTLNQNRDIVSTLTPIHPP